MLTTQNHYPLPSLSCTCLARTPYHGCVCGKQRCNSPHLCPFCCCTSKWCIQMLRCIPRSDETCQTIIFVLPHFFPSRSIWSSSTYPVFYETNSGAHTRAAFSSVLSTLPCARLLLYFSEVTTAPPQFPVRTNFPTNQIPVYSINVLQMIWMSHRPTSHRLSPLAQAVCKLSHCSPKRQRNIVWSTN